MPLSDEELRELGRRCREFYETLDAFKRVMVEKMLPKEMMDLLKKN